MKVDASRGGGLSHLSSPCQPAITGVRAVCMTLVACLILPIFLYTDVRHSLPLGYAGLYTQMADSIAMHGYHLPNRVPFYGPGGMPFAYPPLAVYVMALCTHALSVPVFDYLRFAPTVFMVFCIPPLYALYREFGRDDSVAFLATVLFVTTPGVVSFDAFADGSVRAFAFLWTILGLLLLLRAIQSRSRREVLLAAAAFAAGILSHPENALFLVISTVVFGTREWSRFRTVTVAVGTLAGGVVLAAPWWLVVIQRDGWAVFAAPLHTHDGLTLAALRHPTLFMQRLPLHYIVADTASWLEYACAGIGLLWLVMRRQWLLPCWLIAIMVLMPEGERFWALILAAIAAQAVVPIATAIAGTGLVRVSWKCRHIGCIVGLTVYALWRILSWEASIIPQISAFDVRAANWMRIHTGHESRFLLSTDSSDRAEWFPYLLQRTPVIAPWGGEWTGTYKSEFALFRSQAGCFRRQSLRCLEHLIRSKRLHVNYLIVGHRLLAPRLVAQINRSPHWGRMFSNQDDAIWRSTF
jgi:Dolichyl-phosphate-mannose-protein mannosyltransferase